MAWRQFLVFDLDGTLIDSAPDIADAVNVLLGELGKPAIALSDIKTMIGDGAPVLLAGALKAADRSVRIVAVEPREDVRAMALRDGVVDEALPAPGPSLSVYPDVSAARLLEISQPWLPTQPESYLTGYHPHR